MEPKLNQPLFLFCKSKARQKGGWQNQNPFPVFPISLNIPATNCIMSLFGFSVNLQRMMEKCERSFSCPLAGLGIQLHHFSSSSWSRLVPGHCEQGQKGQKMGCRESSLFSGLYLSCAAPLPKLSCPQHAHVHVGPLSGRPLLCLCLSSMETQSSL